MKRRFTVATAAAMIAATTLATPAMAYEIKDEKGNVVAAVPDDAPVVDNPELVIPEQPAKPAKPSAEEQSAQADLTAKRLENAKKGVETAKTIVDTLGIMGKIFGIGA